MNKVILIGRMTKDADLRFIPTTGTAVATFTIATDKKIKKEGKQQADFHNCVAWGKTAENISNYMGKGRLISIIGRLENRSYDAKDGSKRYITEVIVEETKFLDWKKEGQGSVTAPQDGVPSDYFGDGDMTPIDDGEDMPF